MYRFSWVVLFGFYPAKWFFFKYRNGTEFVHSWKRISIMRLCYRVFFTGFSVDRTTRRLAGTPLFSVGDVPALLFFRYLQRVVPLMSFICVSIFRFGVLPSFTGFSVGLGAGGRRIVWK